MANQFEIPKITAQQVRRVDPTVLQPSPSADKAGGTSFKYVLTESLSEVQRLQVEADDTIQKLVSGEIKDVTQAMVAIEKADVSFQTMMAVRNKIVAAYEEVMRMQV
ncbi:MAG: flagellar hook-basal body complex protein FliE [Candidatus Hydrogenedentota bacterium]